MKHFYYLRLGLLLCFFSLLSYNSFAQQAKDPVQKELNYLTNEQKQLLKEQQQLLDKTRVTLKENLTNEQLALINDRNVSKEQRTSLLKQSLTVEQRNIISSNRDLIRLKKNMFRRSLTKKQRTRLRRFLKKRPLNDRRRLVRRLRRLIQNNMD